VLDFLDLKKMSFPEPPTLAAAPNPLPSSLSCNDQTPSPPSNSGS
jgi:hypothetical protein